MGALRLCRKFYVKINGLMAFVGNQFISRQSNDRFVDVRGHRGLLLLKLSCGKPSITKVLTAPVNDLEPEKI